MPNQLLNRNMRVLLATIAISLSSVTALSVAMAMAALIEDPLLAFVFAAAAVLLDLYKYLAWPIAMGMLASGKRTYAVLMIASALVLGAVSAWATYDRLLTSMMSGQARTAMSQQRLVDLQQLKLDAVHQLSVLDDDARSIRQQARQLRERGIITKAQDLEASSLPRIAAQRDQVLQRIDRMNVDITQLQARTKAIGLPTFLLVLLCAGFAVALEAVPALIGAALRIGAVVESVAPVVVEAETVASAATLETERATESAALTTAEPLPIPGQQHDLFGSGDSDLMERLLGITKATTSGTPIKVRDFATTLKVGNRRVIKLFQAAIDLGALRKTSAGYVAA